MPFKPLKKDSADALTLEWILQVKNYRLILDRKCCVGCRLCTVACPKEAIKTEKQPKTEAGKTPKAKVDIDLAKCNFCGVCDIICPFGAVKVTLNGKHDLSVLTKESYPQLEKDIAIDTKVCPKECVECESVCPLALIKVSKVGFDGKPVEDLSALTPNEKKRVQITVNIQKEKCPTCKVCEVKCPANAIKTKKIFQGKTTINQQKCPDGCHDCLDVCPITGALILGEDKKVHVDETLCIFCGACKNVCPVEGALVVKRTKVAHSPVHSGTWNKALEKITSPEDASKELEAQAAHNRLMVIEKRFEAEALKTGDYR
jgi:4Fe-4S ferredoxin